MASKDFVVRLSSLQKTLGDIRKDVEKRQETCRNINTACISISDLQKKIKQAEEERKKYELEYQKLHFILHELTAEEKVQANVLNDFKNNSKTLQDKFKMEEDKFEKEISEIRKDIEKCIKYARDCFKKVEDDTASEKDKYTHYKHKMLQIEQEEKKIAQLQGEIEALKIIKKFQLEKLQFFKNSED